MRCVKLVILMLFYFRSFLFLNKMTRFFNLFLSLVLFTGFCQCYKILLVFGFPSKSHALLGEGYVRILADAGHEVTFITPYPNQKLPTNVRQIDVSSQIEVLKKQPNLLNIHSFINGEVDIKDINMILDISATFGEGLIHNEAVQQLIHDPKEQFDLVIVEWLFSELASGLATVFDCPYIWSSSMEPHWQVLRLIDDPPHPAYSSDILMESITPFSFWDRISQLWMMVKVTLVRMIKIDGRDEASFQKAFGSAVAKRGRTLASYDDVRFNGSLMLGNSHVSTGEVVRVPRNYVDVGGYHIAEVVDPLPEELQSLMDNSKKGVIYFSMGSIMQGKDLPQNIKDEILHLFAELSDYLVLWKLEVNLENLPKNVRILNWAPQASILAHNKTKLFITHGGLLSTLEAVRFGVPLIGIPGFADQHLNLNRAQKKGFGIRVDLTYELAQDLRTAVIDVLNNPTYAEKAKEASFIFRNRLAPPRQEILHWVRMVVETRGALHLRSPALLVPLYQKLYLDLFALLFTALFIVIVIVNKLRLLLTSFVCGNKKQKEA